MQIPQIIINHLSYHFADGTPLFTDLSVKFDYVKTGLVGRNGIGKSTLFDLLNGTLTPSSGGIEISGKIHLVYQSVDPNSNETVASILGYKDKLAALERIINGSIDQNDYDIIGDDWNIQDRITDTLAALDISYLSLDRPINSLSGGELTRLQLCAAMECDADFLLLDEPTNHLDSGAREILYGLIQGWEKGLIVISHDRELLNFMDTIVELSKLGSKSYGGNYESYTRQKNIEINAAQQELQARKEIADKAKRSVQIRRERHEQNQAKGRRAKVSQIKSKGSYDKIAMNAAKGRSENTNKRIRMQAERKMQQVEQELQHAKAKIEINEAINVRLPKTSVPSGKMVLEIRDLTYQYPSSQHRIIDKFNLYIQGPERVAIKGDNGSGKTTLVNLILKYLTPTSGRIDIGVDSISYLDQSASLLSPELSVVDNFLKFNPERTVNSAYASLAQFLFRNTDAEKQTKHLSGGEKLRALLACVLCKTNPPQLLILDEPTNHLDLYSIQSIESILSHYEGAMLVISHDKMFLENIGVHRAIHTPFKREMVSEDLSPLAS